MQERRGGGRIFFPERGRTAAKGRALCRRCPVASECLDLALARGEGFGIWGGTSGETAPSPATQKGGPPEAEAPQALSLWRTSCGSGLVLDALRTASVDGMKHRSRTACSKRAAGRGKSSPLESHVREVKKGPGPAKHKKAQVGLCAPKRTHNPLVAGSSPAGPTFPTTRGRVVPPGGRGGDAGPRSGLSSRSRGSSSTGAPRVTRRLGYPRP